MDDHDVFERINALVEEERSLYSVAPGRLDGHTRRRRREIEVQLDQCWDLLRQRQALRNAGDDPRQAELRPPEVVESYRQ